MDLELILNGNLKVYRDPATGICERCPVGADWGEGAWPVDDPRWQRLGDVCDECSDYAVRRVWQSGRPTCPVALAHYYTGRFYGPREGQRAMLARAEQIARQRLDATRPESLGWYIRALEVERDRLEFTSELQEVA